MATNINSNTPLWQLTVGEFKELLNGVSETNIVLDNSSPNILHGLDGIALFFGVSKTTALKWKQSGRYKEAITQDGRTITCDAKKMLELRAKNT